MTPFNILRNGCGLNLNQAADFLDVSVSSATSWDNGRRTPPPGAIDELRGLYCQLVRMAEDALDLADESAADEIIIGYPADDDEARQMGLPNTNAWRAMAAMVIAGLDRPYRLVPRGTTIETAAAADAAGR